MLRSMAVWAVSVSAVFICFVGCAKDRGAKSEPKGPVSPDSVKFYAKPPGGSVTKLGMISLPVTPEIRWDDRGDSPKGIAMLKEKAAAMGANGILTDLKPEEYDMTALVGDGKGNWHQIPLKSKPTRTAVAMAIYVEE